MLRYFAEAYIPEPYSETIVLLSNSLVALLAVLFVFKAFSSCRESKQTSSLSRSSSGNASSSSVCDDRSCFRCQKRSVFKDVRGTTILTHLRASLQSYPNLISILDEYQAANQLISTFDLSVDLCETS